MLIQQQIFWLQVPMAHTLVVTKLDPKDKLAEIVARLLLIKLSSVHNLVKEFASADVFQNNKDLGSAREDLKQVHNIVMLDHFHDRDFFLNLRSHILLLYALLVEDLNGDTFACDCVPGILDLDKCPLSECSSNLIFPDLLRTTRRSGSGGHVSTGQDAQLRLGHTRSRLFGADSGL